VVGLTISVVISSIDDEVSCIDVKSFNCSFEKLRVMDNSMFLEVQLLVLNYRVITLVLTPQTFISSVSTFKSYLS